MAGMSELVIAGAGTLFGIVISSMFNRSHKILEYRQEWINSLRIIFFETMDHVELYLNIAHEGDTARVCLEKNKLLSQIYKIKMYMNRNEYMYISLIELLEMLPCKYEGKILNKSDYDDCIKDKSQITLLMQDILKAEWNRVRDGEYQTWINDMKNS